ncbi:MAG: PEP-CTERM sorting domain-containing protein [Akkermansia sp.]|nr:PEP-CTERM sorting domain-containing protein [Akkermansia sp.]
MINNFGNNKHHFYKCPEDGSLCNAKVVPEPTTATLSLLALCGMVARRRRK